MSFIFKLLEFNSNLLYENSIITTHHSFQLTCFLYSHISPQAPLVKNLSLYQSESMVFADFYKMMSIKLVSYIHSTSSYITKGL